MNALNLNLKGKNELRADCKAFGIKNYGRMTNDEMRAAIVVAQNDAVLVAETGHAVCPHCGVHLDNGYAHHSDMKGSSVKLEWVCLGCGGEWGAEVAPKARKAPETEGLKIEKNREERNGIKRPSVGGVCRQVWDFCDGYMQLNGAAPKPKDCKAFATENGLNLNNAVIELYQWRKFMGLSKGV